MKIELLFLGKTKEPYLAAGIADYIGRLSRYARPEIKEIKERGRNSKLAAKKLIEAEGQLLLQARMKSSLLVALDHNTKLGRAGHQRTVVRHRRTAGPVANSLTEGGLHPVVFANDLYPRNGQTASRRTDLSGL
jgi:23S rRNA pseudoU1915 N3-methylase RlmH